MRGAISKRRPSSRTLIPVTLSIRSGERSFHNHSPNGEESRKNKIQEVVTGAVSAVVGILFLLGIVGWFLTRGEPCEDCTLVGVVNAETIVVTSPTRKDFRVWFKSDASPLVTMHPALAGELTRLFRAGKVDARLHSPMMDEDGVQTYRGTEVTISDEPVASKMAYVVQQLAEYEAKRRAQD